jgi:hypothetical protein
VATKVFDTFFDSGENPAVPWTAYNVRILRIILAFKVASILTDEIVEMFWSMLMAKTEAAARAMIPAICDAIIENIELVRDQRSREIISGALTWSRDHPEALDIFIAGRQAKNGHMPNMVAFANLLDGLELLSKRWGRKLRKIVHDRQSQFEGTLAEWHRVFSNAPTNRSSVRVRRSSFKRSTALLSRYRLQTPVRAFRSLISSCGSTGRCLLRNLWDPVPGPSSSTPSKRDGATIIRFVALEGRLRGSSRSSWEGNSPLML